MNPDNNQTYLLPRVGTIFKSYPELCAAMGEPVRSSDSKNAQIARWRTQMDLLQTGRTWRILKIFSQGELQEISTRTQILEKQKKLEATKSLNPRVVINQRKFLLMLRIKESLEKSRDNPEDPTSSNDKYVVFDFKEMDDFLGLVNERFEIEKETEYGLDEFYSDVRIKNKEVTMSVCQSLCSSGLVDGYKSYFATFDSGGETVIPFQALKEIAEVEVSALEALGVRSKSEIHNKGLWRVFLETRKEILKDKFNIVALKRCFVFSTTERLCDWFLENNARDFASRENLRMEINSVNVEKLENFMEKKYLDNLINPRFEKCDCVVPRLKSGFDADRFTTVKDEYGEPLTEITLVKSPIPLDTDFVKRSKRFIAERVRL